MSKPGKPVAFMYECDGMVHDAGRPPIIVPHSLRWPDYSRVEPWTETALYPIDPVELEAENAQLRRRLLVYEHGYTAENITMQVTNAACMQLWDMLGAENQTDAVQRLREMKERLGCCDQIKPVANAVEEPRSP